MSKIKHIPTNEIHILKADNRTTGCGFDTKQLSTHWEKVSDSTRITCAKNGCKN